MRAINTIRHIRSDSDLDFDEIETQVKLTGGSVTDPNTLALLAEQFKKSGQISLKGKDDTLLQLFEVFLSLAVLYGANKKTSKLMLKTCSSLLSEVKASNADHLSDTLLKRLLQNQIFSQICQGLNFATNKNFNERKKEIVAIQTKLFLLSNELHRKLGKDFKTSVNLNRYMIAQIK